MKLSRTLRSSRLHSTCPAPWFGRVGQRAEQKPSWSTRWLASRDQERHPRACAFSAVRSFHHRERKESSPDVRAKIPVVEVGAFRRSGQFQKWPRGRWPCFVRAESACLFQKRRADAPDLQCSERVLQG